MNRTTIDKKVATSSADGYFKTTVIDCLVCEICWCMIPAECRKDHRKICRQPFEPAGPSPYDAGKRMRGGTD